MPVQQLITPGVGRDCRYRGFTLIELLVVLALLAIMLSVSMPRFRATILDDPLKQSARQVVTLIREARQRAAVSEQGCFLEIDIEVGTYKLYCPGTSAEDEGVSAAEDGPQLAITLPDRVRIDSIFAGEAGRLSTGMAVLWINRRGLMEPSIINLSSGNEAIGLEISPFLPRVALTDQALNPGDRAGWRP